MLHSVHAFRDPVAPPLRRTVSQSGRVEKLPGDSSLSKILTIIGRTVGASGVALLRHVAAGATVPSGFGGACGEGDFAVIEMIDEVSGLPSVPFGKPQWHPVVHRGTSSMLMMLRIDAGDDVFNLGAIFTQHIAFAKSEASQAIIAILPLLEGCLSLWVQRENIAVHTRALKIAIDNSAFGVVLLDVDRAIVLVNETADRLLTLQDGIRRVGKSVGGSALGDSMRLQTAIDHVITHKAAPETAICAMRRDDGRRPLMIAVSPIGGDSSTSDCAALLQIIDPSRDFAPLLEPVCRHYGLSPVETRLAVRLTLGHSLMDAAKAMRLREATARSYLKQIFLKTDIKRQSELVGILLKSCVPATFSSGAMAVPPK